VVVDEKRVGYVLRNHSLFLLKPTCLGVVLADVLKAIDYEDTFSLRALRRLNNPIVIHLFLFKRIFFLIFFDLSPDRVEPVRKCLEFIRKLVSLWRKIELVKPKFILHFLDIV
jgi:hypothetical protein